MGAFNLWLCGSVLLLMQLIFDYAVFRSQSKTSSIVVGWLVVWSFQMLLTYSTFAALYAPTFADVFRKVRSFIAWPFRSRREFVSIGTLPLDGDIAEPLIQ